MLHDEVLGASVQPKGVVELDVRDAYDRLRELPVHHRAVWVHHVPALDASLQFTPAFLALALRLARVLGSHRG